MSTPPQSAARQGKRFLVAVTTLAAPLALGFETLFRKLLFPLLMGDDFELVRGFLRPLLTPVAWALGLLALAMTLVGWALHAMLAARALARLPAEKRALPAERERAELRAFMVAASVPQLPCVLATFTFMFGAALLPVLVAVGLGSLGVCVLALRTRSAA